MQQNISPPRSPVFSNIASARLSPNVARFGDADEASSTIGKFMGPFQIDERGRRVECPLEAIITCTARLTMSLLSAPQSQMVKVAARESRVAAVRAVTHESQTKPLRIQRPPLQTMPEAHNHEATK